jgi:hypothetical protein
MKRWIFFRALVVARECVNLQQSLIPPHRPTECLVYVQIFTEFSRIGFRLFWTKMTLEIVPTQKAAAGDVTSRACDCQFSILTHPI